MHYWLHLIISMKHVVVMSTFSCFIHKVLLPRAVMHRNRLTAIVIICFWIFSTYLHILAELNAIDEYNTSLYEGGVSFRNVVHVPHREDIDVVYTWVNGSEKKFKQDLDEYISLIRKARADVLALNRYFDYGTLRYSLRSIEKYANWVRYIYLVTNDQIPDWLNKDNPRIKIVTHKEIFLNKSHLPTFSSPAIECHIHNIKGLSNNFIYMNDDIILTSRLELSDFLTEDGKYELRFMHEKLERCNKLCASNNVSNGVCEPECNTASCEWDGDDCAGKKVPTYTENDRFFMFDSWMGSMMHAHFLFNKVFGPANRYIPEHGPHMFNRDILRLLQYSFLYEWDKTSSIKIRHHLTMQYQFAYNNFLLTLEENGLVNVKTNLTFVKECCNKDILELDNRDVNARRKQLDEAKKRLQLLKPKFLVITTRFLQMMYENDRDVLVNDITNFLHELFPTPSLYEIS
ncbi:N-acetylglucosamine-1-phosphotransferase subunits alpha/beta-like isoform X2 [Ruditapes philippinarum]|uniref:N-acetylglucosamine-1-phosphotransferase subunits alpha/beta-like isoform X2 n=1 Tax=Ruditapes philippinarum TaxID=129788 RepID=UPI00295C190D|nr:N-acetylglucosamine-1-phosphotransferase subunits alpha/beta-like isoform X2 [Ruditapes philippinarum]